MTDIDHTKTQYFQYLLTHIDILEKQRVEFNDKISSLLNSEVDELGIVLKCHLIIEHYIDEYITVAYPSIVEFEKIKLTFNQKLELINNKRTLVGLSYTAIKSFNTLRNKFSHKLSYKIVESDYKEIKDLLTIWNNLLKKETIIGLSLIQDFTVFVCGDLNSMIQGIKRESPKHGLTGYLEWLNKMMNE